MNQDAIFHGIDYFVDNDPSLIGTTYLGKPIYAPDVLLSEDKNNLLILIGSVVYYTELRFQLEDMGFEKDKHFVWGISFPGDDKCPRLLRYNEFSSDNKNKINMFSETTTAKLKIIARLIDFSKYKTIVDLGAGPELLSAYLPNHCKYVPVDYLQYTDRTVLCDMLRFEFPRIEDDKKSTLFVSSNHIGYASDWRWYVDEIAKRCDCLIFAKQDFASISREYRKTKWNFSNIAFNHEYVMYVLSKGFKMTDALNFRLRTDIYKFER
jgi:hypothetical protein